jgi:hypothetical protein
MPNQALEICENAVCVTYLRELWKNGRFSKLCRASFEHCVLQIKQLVLVNFFLAFGCGEFQAYRKEERTGPQTSIYPSSS